MSYIEKLIKERDLESLYIEKRTIEEIIKRSEEELSEIFKYIKSSQLSEKNYQKLLKNLKEQKEKIQTIENAINILEEFRRF